MTFQDFDSYWLAEKQRPVTFLEEEIGSVSFEVYAKLSLLAAVAFTEHLTFNPSGGIPLLLGALLDNYTTYRTGRAMIDAEAREIFHGLEEKNPLLGKLPTLDTLISPKSIMIELVYGVPTLFSPPVGITMGIIRTLCAYNNYQKEQRLRLAISIHETIEERVKKSMTAHTVAFLDEKEK